MEDEIELIDYIRIMVKKRYFIIAGTLLCTLFSIIYSYTIIPTYEATAKILITKPKIRISLENRIQTDITPDTSIATMIELVKNRELVEKIVLTLNKKYPELKVEGLSGMVDVEQVQGTNLLGIKIVDSDKNRVAQIANLWAEYFIERNNDLYSLETKKAYDFIAEQLSYSKSNLLKVEEDLKDFNEQSTLSYLQSAIYAIEGAVTGGELIMNIKSGTTVWETGGERTMLGDKGLVEYGERLQDIRILLKKKEAELKMAQPLLTNRKDPSLQEFISKTKIEEESLKAEYTQIKREITRMQERLKKLKKQMEKQLLIKVRLEREAKKALATYEMLDKKQQELKLALYASDTGAIVVAEKAYPPKHPLWPNKRKIVGLTAVLSFLIFLVLVILMEYFQKMYRDEEIKPS